VATGCANFAATFIRSIAIHNTYGLHLLELLLPETL
jgi:hypothetical protein